MKITIKYDSSWRNSFLDGSNNEPLPKHGRSFVASMTALKQKDNFKQHTISKDTVMGILNRLIGEQRKLYQARQDPNYYFKAIEETFQDSDIVDNVTISNEIIYVRNMLGNKDQNSFTGMIKAKDPAFVSSFSPLLWGVLWLEIEQVIDFILSEQVSIPVLDDIDPIMILQRLESLNKQKAMEVVDKIEKCHRFLQHKYPEVDYKLTTKGQFLPISFYTSALYIQIERLSEHDATIRQILTKAGNLSGISKRGFTPKDFMKAYTTGDQKMIWGNPYLLKERKKGEGETVSVLQKANGTLEIILNINPEAAHDLRQKIINAGVSAFYLGKKGLAYVEKID